MMIEISVANPAANDFNHVHADFNKQVRVLGYFVIGDCYVTSLADCFIAIYRGAINSYDKTNYASLVWAGRFYWTSGTATPWGQVTPNQMLNVPLEPGSYTFAVYTVTDIAYLRACFYYE